MTKRLDHKTWAILIFGVAFLIRLIYLLQIKSNPYFYAPMIDELWNLRWANDILTDSFLGKEVYFRGPLYPYLLALFLKITSSDYFWTRFLQIFISAGSVSLTYLLGREFFSEKTARLASIFYAFYGTLILYDEMFLIPVVFVFLNLLGLVIIARNRDNPHKRPFIIAGIVFGLAAIARPNILVVVPCLAIWLFYNFRRKVETRSIVLIILVFLIGVALPIAPVTVRNYVVADDFVLISSQGGINLYLGNNSSAEGLTMMMPEITLDASIPWNKFIPAVTDFAEKEVGHKLKPSEVSSFWTNKAKQFIFEHPAEFMYLTFKKCVYFLSGFENSDQTDIYAFRQYSSLLSVLIFDRGLKFPYGFFLPLAIVGMGLGYAHRKTYAPLYIFVLAYIPTVVLFLVTARHRLTIIPILLLFASFAVLHIYDRIKNKGLRQAILPIAAGLVLLVLVNINFFDLGFHNTAQTHYNLGLTYSRQGDYPAAIREYNLALKETPNLAIIHFGLGTAYYKMGRQREAISYLNKAVELEPGYTDALINLGLCYSDINQLERAERAFRLAVKSDSTRVEPYFNLGDILMAKNDLEGARRAYMHALDLQPDNNVLYTKVGVVYGRVNDTAAAYPYFRQALDIDSTYSPAWLNWGNICLINGDTAQAMEKYNDAIAVDSTLAEPYYNLAIIYIRLGDLAKARANVDALLRVQPDFKPGLDLKKRLGD